MILNKNLSLKRLTNFLNLLINVAAVTVSGPDIGMGHLIRTIQLLSLLDKEKFKYEIVGENYSLPTWIHRFNHKFTKLRDIDISSLNKFDLVIFDSYLQRDILDNVSTKTLLIDDFNYLGDTKVDMILDYNYGSSSDLYQDDLEVFVSPDYFPISYNTIPEYYNMTNTCFNIDGDILLSFGGVSDKKLIDIKKQINFYKRFGDIILMDPLSKLNEFKPYVKDLIQNQSLSDIFSTRKIKFSKVAGGTSKYICLAYNIPIIYVHRNDLEKYSIDKLKQNNLCLEEKDLEDLHNQDLINQKLIYLNNKYSELFFFNKAGSINNKLQTLI